MYHAKPDHHTPSLIHGDWISESLQIGLEDHWFVLIHQLPVRVQILLNRHHAVFVCCCWPSKHRGRAYVSEASAWEKQAGRFFFALDEFNIVWLWRAIQYTKGSVYVISTYICQTNGPNPAKYTWSLWPMGMEVEKQHTYEALADDQRNPPSIVWCRGRIGSKHQVSLINH